ncbi:hypothetical protein QZH41_007654 [Actinostola sp. cb2023]|nr:hypothetical protein QZH41_007654 [Actinostola sp. cb2023]
MSVPFFPTHLASGNYAYMQAGKRLLGEKAVLQLKDLKINSSQEECLSIEYYMYGRDIETLEIRQEYDKPLLFLTGSQGEGWKKAAGKLYLPTIAGQSLSTTLFITAVVGVDEKGDIAIDEIKILPGKKCSNIINQSVTCHFEYDLCGWSLQQGDGNRIRGRSSQLQTGPTRDNTPGLGGRGYYVFADSNKKEANYVTSMKYTSTTSVSGCLQFAYFMYGSSVGRLRLFADDKIVFDRVGQSRSDYDDPWEVAMGFVQFKDLKFEVTNGDSNLGNVAIDDIVFTNNTSCGKQEITCPAIKKVYNGKSTCSEKPTEIDKKCQIMCNEGFNILS